MYNIKYYQKSADYVLRFCKNKPMNAIILGTALGSLADEIENPVIIDYKDIPNFLVSTAPSHAGKLILGKISGKDVVCMSGRFHYYEGYTFEQLAAPIRLFKLLGVKNVIVTNAAGAVNKDYSPGDVMIISDHINLVGASPMRGTNIDEIGNRFFDCSNLYDKNLRKIAKNCSKNSTLKFHEGIYQYFVGPQFESPAEIRACRILGADAVGMSTVTEALTAAHCNLPFLGLSLITNMAAGILPNPISGEEVDNIATASSKKLKAFMKDLIKNI